MKKVTLLAVFLMLTLIVTSGFAQVKKGSVNITPTIGMYKFEGSEDMESSIAVGLRAGYFFTKYIGVEGFAHWVPTAIIGDPTLSYGRDQGLSVIPGTKDKINVFGYGVEGIFNILPDGVLVPFLAAGVGGIHYTDATDDTTDGRYNKFAMDYGAGLKWFITENIALRGDVRHIIPINGHQNNLLATVGLTLAFGGEKKVVEPLPEPVPEPVVAPPPPPPPAPAPEIIEKGKTTLKVLFDFDKSIIKKGSFGDVDNLVGVMKNYPDLNVAIEGHTDYIGTNAYNQKLSQRRADAVKKYMVEKGGIDAKRLKAIGYGEEKPIADNKTKEGRAQNRRVEAVAEYLIKK